MSDVKLRFGEQLRKVRHQLAISQEKLADLAGLHRTYISSVERGERNVTIETIERLAAALKVNMRELLPDAPLLYQEPESGLSDTDPQPS